MKNQCMARNKDNTARCERRATRMIPTRGHKTWSQEDPDLAEADPSVPTLHLCGICANRLRSGSQSLCLEIDDQSRHVAWVSEPVGPLPWGEVIRTRSEWRS